MNKSHYENPLTAKKDWHVVDLNGKVLGRAATQIATLLRGKHKPTFTPAVDMGDFVVAINAEKIKLTGKKMDEKFYFRHTRYMGGLKKINVRDLLKKDPSAIITAAVQGMLPKGPLGRKQLKKLKVYAGDQHPHTAQKPSALEI